MTLTSSLHYWASLANTTVSVQQAVVIRENLTGCWTAGAAPKA
jgi:hypothetical protein